MVSTPMGGCDGGPWSHGIQVPPSAGALAGAPVRSLTGGAAAPRANSASPLVPDAPGASGGGVRDEDAGPARADAPTSRHEHREARDAPQGPEQREATERSGPRDGPGAAQAGGSADPTEQDVTSSSNPHGRRAVSPARPRPSSTIAAYRDLLLGGEPTLTARDLASRTGTQVRRVAQFWLAMGFQPVPPDQVAFTHADLDAYATWSGLIDSGSIDLATGLSLLRAQSHMADRLSLWQMESLVEDAMRRLDLDDTTARIVTLDRMRRYLDFLHHEMVYSWRRQLEALLERADAEISHRAIGADKHRFPLTRSLGFVDMVSYTSSSAILGQELIGLVERFEEACRSAVAEAGGRVVKMIGDAALFIADDLPTGLRVVAGLMDRLNGATDILPVRASFVRGDVFSRSGDVFGPPVNLASRLVDIAPVGKVLTDPSTAAAVSAGKGGSGYGIENFPSADLQGVGRVSPYVLSWQSAARAS